MAKGKSKRNLIIVIAVVAVVLLGAAGAYALWQNNHKTAVETPVNTPDTSTKDTDSTKTEEETPKTETPTTPEVDPATLSSIDIEPLSISVFYTKGVPGFEFNVLRTADRTQYVEFSSPDLVGTKCTNDTGAFVSIIKNPGTSDGTTISQKKTVGSDTYGLSLAADTCTKDADLLKEYQTAFTNGFSQLKAIE